MSSRWEGWQRGLVESFPLAGSVWPGFVGKPPGFVGKPPGLGLGTAGLVSRVAFYS